MSFLNRLRLRFSPPRLTDSEFGELRFIYIANAPDRSYWEGEWKFPQTSDVVSIFLPGTEDGPLPESRAFCLSLPNRYEKILADARPKLAKVFRDWLDQELPDDMFSVVKLAGFGVDDPGTESSKWDVGFETLGDKWLYITIPYEGEIPGEPMIDS